MSYVDKLTHYYPGKSWHANGDTYAGIVWQDESPKPSKATLDGLVWPVTPPPTPPTPTLVASGVFTVDAGWVEGVEAASGIGMVFPIDTGTYWLFFTAAQPDLSYATYASASRGQINVSARSLDYIELCVTEAGVLTDPSEFSINIVRAQ